MNPKLSNALIFVICELARHIVLRGVVYNGISTHIRNKMWQNTAVLPDRSEQRTVVKKVC